DLWVTQAGVVQRLRNGGTAGVADEELYKSMLRYIDRYQGPGVARDVIIFRHAIDTWNFAEASAAADRLLPVIRSQPRWIAPDEFRDGAVMAKLQTGRAKIARRMLDYLEP